MTEKRENNGTLQHSPSAFWLNKNSLSIPFSNLLYAFEHYLRWEDTWGPEEPDSHLGCDITLIDHAQTSFHTSITIVRATPGSSSRRYPLPMRRGNTERAPGLALWVISLPLRVYEHIIKHMKAYTLVNLMTDRRERIDSFHTFSNLIK